ncbi:MAG: hypothetical protein M3040_13250 [Bacteroidota bacterium]|nr:hypothetical protein [Bacteroidota bacterium]
MKNLLMLALMIYCTSCAGPEDKATGNANSTMFNKSGNGQNLNAPASTGNQSTTNNNDTSAIPSTSKQNVNSPTEGTNRPYKAGGDSSRNK